MEQLVYWIGRIDSFVWGAPLLILLTSVGLFLTIRLRGVQFRYLWYAHKLAFTRHDDNAKGDISHFQALMTALAGTIGIGSIAGVATAIVTGGLGSIFWMWVAALLGMATKYAESMLSLKYRVTDEHNEMCGGPMYFLEKGMNAKVLAVLFAVFGAITAIGTGNMVQANSVAQALQELVSFDPQWTGVVLTVVTGFALFGGIKRIGKIAGILVPVMSAFYLVSGLVILAIKLPMIPQALWMIVKTAFTGQAAAGGFLGSTIMAAIQMGVSRGVFSSEAGLGTSSISAAAAKTDTPGRQAMISMCTVFITSCVVCTITGLVIAVSGCVGMVDANGVALNGSILTIKAFEAVIPNGGALVTIALIPFAYSTILGWAYYGEKCVEYLFGIKATKPYRVIYTLTVLAGSALSLELAWGFANIMNGLMAFPNLIGLLFLSKVVVTESKMFEGVIRAEAAKRLE